MERSLLPPDMRRQVVDQEARAHRGIGGAAKENAEEAQARARAMGTAPTEAAEAEKKAEGTPAPQAAMATGSCAGCRATLDSEWNFCAKCGRDLVADREPGKWLGIRPFSDEEVQEWLFRGYLVRDLPILGTHRLRVKTSQPSDAKEVDKYFVQGEYKNEPISQDLFRQLHMMATVAASLYSFDDQSIGEKLSERMAWLEGRGSPFVDMVTYRVALFNRAWTAFVQEKDKNRIMGS